MRTRLPVKLKVAVLSAALTFAILCLFAVVVGTVAERRIVGGFDDELRANAGDLQDRITLQQTADGSIELSDVRHQHAARLRRWRRDRARRRYLQHPSLGKRSHCEPGSADQHRRSHRHR